MNRLATAVQVAAICFVLGVLIVVQLRSAERAAGSALSTADQARMLATLVRSNADLRAEVAELEAQLALLNPADRDDRGAALQAELDRLLVLSGGTEVRGPGVQIEVSGQISALDMQDLINELRNAGAEAIALGNQRIVVHSVVVREGNALVLHGVKLAPTYVLAAIGPAETMEKALLRPGGLVSLLEFAYPGLAITVTKREGLILPAHGGGRVEFVLAQPTP